MKTPPKLTRYPAVMAVVSFYSIEGTFYEKGLLVINVHEAVGAGIAIASKGVPDQLLPGRLANSDVVVFHPAVLTGIVDVRPVVTSISLAFMNQHSMKSVWNLVQHNVSMAFEFVSTKLDPNT